MTHTHTLQVYCSVPAGAEEEEEMIRETVKEECCEQTYWRCSGSSSSSLRVVSGERYVGCGEREWVLLCAGCSVAYICII